MLLTAKKRKRQHNVRLNAEEMKRSKRLQDHYDVGFSTLVRLLMKEKERDLEREKGTAAFEKQEAESGTR